MAFIGVAAGGRRVATSPWQTRRTHRNETPDPHRRKSQSHPDSLPRSRSHAVAAKDPPSGNPLLTIITPPPPAQRNAVIVAW
jgi:hypothetical protein